LLSNDYSEGRKKGGEKGGGKEIVFAISLVCFLLHWLLWQIHGGRGRKRGKRRRKEKKQLRIIKDIYTTTLRLMLRPQWTHEKGGRRKKGREEKKIFSHPPSRAYSNLGSKDERGRKKEKGKNPMAIHINVLRGQHHTLRSREKKGKVGGGKRKRKKEKKIHLSYCYLEDKPYNQGKRERGELAATLMPYISRMPERVGGKEKKGIY